MSTTTHLLDLGSCFEQYDFAVIHAGDPLVVPLTLVGKAGNGYIYRVNEKELGEEIAQVQRRRMITFRTAQGFADEIIYLLVVEGMRVFSWLLPAGVYIREVVSYE